MSDLARVVVILERTLPSELDNLDSDYRERLEEVLHRWWTLTSRARRNPGSASRPTEYRSGILSHLQAGERAP